MWNAQDMIEKDKQIAELEAELAESMSKLDLEKQISSDIALMYQQETGFKHTIKQIRLMATIKTKEG